MQRNAVFFFFKFYIHYYLKAIELYTLNVSETHEVLVKVWENFLQDSLLIVLLSCSFLTRRTFLITQAGYLFPEDKADETCLCSELTSTQLIKYCTGEGV